MFYLELLLLVVPHHAGALGCQVPLGPYHLGVLGHPVHDGPHLPQVQGDTWECLEGSQSHHYPLVKLTDLKEFKGVKILTNFGLMLVTTIVSHRNRV